MNQLTYSKTDAAARLGVGVDEFDNIVKSYPELLPGIKLHPNAKQLRYSESSLYDFVAWCVKMQAKKGA